MLGTSILRKSTGDRATPIPLQAIYSPFRPGPRFLSNERFCIAWEDDNPHAPGRKFCAFLANLTAAIILRPQNLFQFQERRRLLLRLRDEPTPRH